MAAIELDFNAAENYIMLLSTRLPSMTLDWLS